MRRFILLALASSAVATGAVRSAEPGTDAIPEGTTPATAADVEALRQQVQSLTAVVEALQKQV